MKKLEEGYIIGMIQGLLLGILVTFVACLFILGHRAEKNDEALLKIGEQRGFNRATNSLIEYATNCKPIVIGRNISGEDKILVTLLNEACLHG